MSDETDYGRTKSEISNAFAEIDGWSTTAGGATVAGYELILLPYLTNVTADADKSVTTLFEGGMGVDGNAYTITNWTQLQNLNHSNILSQNYFFSLLNSIDSSTADYTDLASATANGGKGWNSIGNSASQFKGNFDGTNKTISNLYINDATSDYIGLFGYINSATIKNIGVVNANVSGKDDVGGLVGFAKNSTIESSYTTGAVSGNGAVGGLVGLNLGLDGDAIIKNSYSTANVTGGSSTGGLVGKNGAEINGAEPAKATIENSYATGKVTGTSNVGGLVGHNEAYVDGGSGTSTATIKNSYATGEVSGTSSSGGLIGLNKIYVYGGSGTATVTVIDSFFTKEADDTTTVGIGGNSASQDGVTGKTTAEMKNIATFTGWDTNIWSFDSSKVAGNALDAQIYLKHVTRAEDIVAGEKLFEGGFGTAESAYTITNWTQLQNINHANILTQNYFFSLLNDLGSSTSDYTNLASATANGGKGWKAIGSSSSNKFVGNFDGTNKTISDLSINDTSKDRLGLFGYTDSATIKNIGVVNADVSGESYVGALVGFAKNSIIENSYAIGGNIHGSSENIGGLVGNSEQSNIRNSYAANKVTGSNNAGGYVGGLVGTNYGGTIENSYAIGEVVSVGTKVGGLVGKDSGTIKNSYAAGKVTGDDQVGGLVGISFGANIENSYATGQVVATSSSAFEVGGLVGVNYNGGTITNSFYNTSTSGQTVGIGGNSASQDGVTGKTTAQMQDKATFSDATWSIVEDSTINKGTPFLAWQDSSKGYTKVWVIGTKVAPSPDPVVPDPIKPDPKPDPVDPTPPTPDPVVPDPIKPDPKPDPVDPTPPSPDPVVPDPIKPDPVVEQEIKDAQKVIISIVNKEATKVVVPKVQPALQTPISVDVANISFSEAGQNKFLVSKPIEGQTTKRVSLSEAREMQVEAGVQSSEVRVPLSRDSIIQLVDGGVKLPDGVEQEFYVADDR
ncbi:MAG: GLUG motif-containing protein [Pseudomonas sp.]|nr:GLUG motif-containing protein [Pseudomonas sp.]